MSAGMGSLMEWHNELRMMRKRAGLTQGQIAESIGLDQSSVSSYETGRRFIPTDLLDKWAEACGAVIEVHKTGDLPFGPIPPGLVEDVRLLVQEWISLPSDVRDETRELIGHWGKIPVHARAAILLLAKNQ